MMAVKTPDGGLPTHGTDIPPDGGAMHKVDWKTFWTNFKHYARIDADATMTWYQASSNVWIGLGAGVLTSVFS